MINFFVVPLLLLLLDDGNDDASFDHLVTGFLKSLTESFTVTQPQTLM